MLFVATLLTPQISMFERNIESPSFNVRNHNTVVMKIHAIITQARYISRSKYCGYTSGYFGIYSIT